MLSLVHATPVVARSLRPNIHGDVVSRFSGCVSSRRDVCITERQHATKTYRVHELNSFLVSGKFYPETTSQTKNIVPASDGSKHLDGSIYRHKTRRLSPSISGGAAGSCITLMQKNNNQLAVLLHVNQIPMYHQPYIPERELREYADYADSQVLSCAYFVVCIRNLQYAVVWSNNVILRHQRQDAEGPANSPQQRFRQTVRLLQSELPKVLAPDTLDKNLYSDDIEFTDKVSGLRVYGKAKYDFVLGAFAAGTKVCFVAPEFYLIWCNSCESTRTISCRWQVRGNLRVPLVPPSLNYYDRHSVFDVDHDGRIWRHTIDRMTPMPPGVFQSQNYSVIE